MYNAPADGNRKKSHQQLPRWVSVLIQFFLSNVFNGINDVMQLTSRRPRDIIMNAKQVLINSKVFRL